MTSPSSGSITIAKGVTPLAPSGKRLAVKTVGEWEDLTQQRDALKRKLEDKPSPRTPRTKPKEKGPCKFFDGKPGSCKLGSDCKWKH